MKAAVLRKIGSPANVRLEEVSDPQPGAGEVRIKLRACALNRRDVWITVGEYGRIQLPSIGGSDGAGVVERCGDGVDVGLLGTEVVLYPARDWGEDPRCGGANFRVLGMPDQGTFAEYVCTPASDICARPEHLTWEQAAALPLAGLTAWRAVVTHGEVQAGQKVLVTGIGGGVAGFALMWAREHGAEVWVTSSAESKLDAAATLGAAGGVNYHAAGWGKALKKESGGFDLVIDSAGGEVVNAALSTLKPGGRFVFYGATLGNPPSGIEMARFFFKQLRFQGSTMGTPAEFKALVDFVATRKLEPIVDEALPFTEVARAHEKLFACEQMGKLVLRI